MYEICKANGKCKSISKWLRGDKKVTTSRHSAKEVLLLTHKKNLSLDVCNLFSSSPCLMCIWWYYKEKQQKNIQNAIHPITISLLWQRYFLIYVRLRVKISASVAIFDFFGYKVICWRNHYEKHLTILSVWNKLLRFLKKFVAWKKVLQTVFDNWWGKQTLSITKIIWRGTGVSCDPFCDTSLFNNASSSKTFEIIS